MSRELDNLRKQKDASMKKLSGASEGFTVVEDHTESVLSEQVRVNQIAKAPMVVIDNIDSKFKKATKLTSLDISFLFVATAMQVLRQYLVTSFPSERASHDKSATDAKKQEKKLVDDMKESGDVTADELNGYKNNRSHRYYQPSLAEILANPVPFDTSNGAKDSELLKGFGKLGHRGATPGHDPILGFIFGTANIATSTITNWRMESYHVSSGEIGNSGKFADLIKEHAKTPLVLSHTCDKLFHGGVEGKQIIGVSLAKEYLHLKSDIDSKHSLPLPAISMISPKVAGELAHIGLDMANVKQIGKQALYASLINVMVSMIHGMLYDETKELSHRLYQVRTRKILSYSNLLASTSNVIVTACSRDLMKLDIGGLAVTLFRFIRDTKFINDVKEEFLREEFYDRVVGSEYDFLQGV